MSLKYAYATLVATDSYAIGATVLRSSLLAAGSPHPLVIMHTPKVSPDVVTQLGNLPNVLLFSVALLYPNAEQATSYAFERFQDVWTKLRVFELTQYDTVVFLDSDMLCTQNMDELFDSIDSSPDSLVASLACICNPMKLAHYPTWWKPENCPYWKHEHGIPVSDVDRKYFNSGMFVLHPNNETAKRLMSCFQQENDLSCYYFPDQCFLNEMFPHFKVTSYKYNAVKTLRSAHPKTWNMEEIKNLHFILTKPWNINKNSFDLDDLFIDLYEFWWAVEASLKLDVAVP